MKGTKEGVIYMKRKMAMVTSLALGSLLILGQKVSAENHDHMMNGNGMMKMMDTMQSPHGQKMMAECKQMME